MTLVVSRRRVMVVCAVAATAAAVFAWYMQPEKRLMRAWRDMIRTVENRNATAFRGMLAADYSDRWGNTRDSLVDDARRAFASLRSLSVRSEQVTVNRDDDRATITAILRIDLDGPAYTQEARARINGIFTPFVFEWRRESGFPWDWHLARFDQPGLDLERLRRDATLPGW